MFALALLSLLKLHGAVKVSVLSHDIDGRVLWVRCVPGPNFVNESQTKVVSHLHHSHSWRVMRNSRYLDRLDVEVGHRVGEETVQQGIVGELPQGKFQGDTVEAQSRLAPLTDVIEVQVAKGKASDRDA